ncbi:MAG TPA: TonB-dependent receptor [Lacibacter sp.]|nr:TonB-dependent receptor [Lacibacter sp.]HMO88696.1 TonB-dependent receptor [Lacibacter sp.]HMP87365.1 TonB-dependent receptor [Lacibacter sp.]
MRNKLFLVAALLACSPVLAQNDSASARFLDEVIITANRVEQKQSQTGKVVTVIGKEVLERSKGRTVAQLLNEQAGITINGALNNAGTVQTLFMRGAASGRVLVLLDGIPVGDPSFINNEFDLNFLSITDVERIEIARGAQSTLYGSDAVTGVINIISVKKNVTRPLQVKSTLAGGNNSTFRGNLQAFGTKGKLSYQARYSRLSTRGFSAAFDSAGNKGFDRDGYRGNVANGALQYQATAQLSFRSFVQYSGYRSDVDAGVFTDDRDFTINNRTLMSGAGFTYKTEQVNVTGNYQYGQNKRLFLNDSGHVSGFSKFVQDEYFSKSQFAELYASIRISPSLTLLQGGDYRFGFYNNQFLSISSFGPFRTNFKDTSVSQSSLYASLLYSGLKGRLTVELGGRLNVHSRYGSNHTYTFNPSLAVNDRIRVFGSVATGFKAPGLYQLYSTFGNRDLQPEESVNYEVGAEQKANKLRHRLVGFYRDIDNGMDFDNIGFRYFNFPRQLVRGLEYEASVQLLTGWQLTGNYTWISGTEFTQSRISFKDTAYTYLLRRPAHQAQAHLRYQHKGGWAFTLSGRYVSRRFDAGGFKVQDVALGSYFLVNAYAEYQPQSRIRFFADAQNLTQTRFFDLRGFNSIPLLVTAGCTFEW